MWTLSCLVIIDLFIYRFNVSDEAWVGLSDQDMESVFRWLNRDVLTYDAWVPGQPNWFTKENYVRIGASGMHASKKEVSFSRKTLCSTKRLYNFITPCRNIKEFGKLQGREKILTSKEFHFWPPCLLSIGEI